MSGAFMGRGGFVAGLTILFLSSARTADRSVIREIRFTGNHALGRQQLLDALASKSSQGFVASRLSLDLGNILELYRQEGYYFTQVDHPSLQYSDDSSEVTVTFSVVEGARAGIGDIALQGNTVFR